MSAHKIVRMNNRRLETCQVTNERATLEALQTYGWVFPVIDGDDDGRVAISKDDGSHHIPDQID